MPPRRSCFSALRWTGLEDVHVSMPPRRSCFEGRAGRPQFDSMFQCRHGVPASVFLRSLRQRGRARFNATTAFLLRRHRRRQPVQQVEFQCHHGVLASWCAVTRRWSGPGVSMPPRRSCFSLADWYVRYLISGFNATTAFLLLWAPQLDPEDVSRFNATTAFLLPVWALERGIPFVGFIDLRLAIVTSFV